MEYKEFIPLDKDQPWNSADVLKKLVWATKYLLHDKDNDGPNYEELTVCVKRGEELIRFLEEKTKEQFYAAEEDNNAVGENSCPPRQYWNYRLLAHENPAPGTGYCIMIHEVHYEGCKPSMYATNPASIHTDIEDLQDTPINNLKQTITWVRAALKKPVLWAGPKFPQVFEHETLLTKQ